MAVEQEEDEFVLHMNTCPKPRLPPKVRVKNDSVASTDQKKSPPTQIITTIQKKESGGVTSQQKPSIRKRTYKKTATSLKKVESDTFGEPPLISDLTDKPETVQVFKKTSVNKDKVDSKVSLATTQ